MTRRADVAGRVFDELLNGAYDRVKKAMAGGNRAAIHAAQDAYFELRISIEIAEQQASRSIDQENGTVLMDSVSVYQGATGSGSAP